MKIEDDTEDCIMLTSAADNPLQADTALPYMMFDPNMEKARYFVVIRAQLDAIGNPTEVEIDAQTYRDVVATLALRSRSKLNDLLDTLDYQDLTRAIRQIAYADEP